MCGPKEIAHRHMLCAALAVRDHAANFVLDESILYLIGFGIID